MNNQCGSNLDGSTCTFKYGIITKSDTCLLKSKVYESVTESVCVRELHWVPDGLLCRSASLHSAPEGGVLVTQRDGTQGHSSVCPETRLLRWGNIRDKDLSCPGGCRELQGPCSSLAAKVREGYDTTCMLRIHKTHTHMNIQPTEQPVSRAPQDYCFDNQGEKIVIERTSDTCVVRSWRGDTGHTHIHTHTSQSKVDVITMD